MGSDVTHVVTVRVIFQVVGITAKLHAAKVVDLTTWWVAVLCLEGNAVRVPAQ